MSYYLERKEKQEDLEMNSHIDKGVECLIEAYKHMVKGYTFELKYRSHPRGLKELMAEMDATLQEAKRVETRYREDLRDHKFQKAKLGEVIEDLIELRKEAYIKLVLNKG